MSFVEPAFPVFLLVVLALYAAVPWRLQNVVLAVASSIFYGWVHPWFLLLLGYSALLNYGSALALVRWPARRAAIVTACIVQNALLLGVFKYFDFFVENVVAAAAAFGVHLSLPVLGILLPVGISFFTFQTLGYTLDVYRGKVAARTDLLHFYLFVVFFPQLVAGPIERADNLLVQIERPRTMTFDGLRSGLSLALWGAFKKVAIADGVAPYVDVVFAQDERSQALVWAGALGFMVQIFADFSGYTDIARGTARMLGFELMENFRAPYLATSPTDLWDRWHISLSRWLRDNLYYPLASSRWARRNLVWPWLPFPPRFHVYRGVLATMVFSGLWHGAAWHFVLWGTFYGVVQVAHLEAQWSSKRLAAWLASPWVALPGMFVVQVVAALIFREHDVGRLFGVVTLPLVGSAEQLGTARVVLAMAVAGALPMVLGFVWSRRIWPRLGEHPLGLAVSTTGWVLAAFWIWVLYRPATTDFIYFQF